MSIRRWNSARSRGGICFSRSAISARAPASSSSIERWVARQSFSFSSCASVSRGKALFAGGEVLARVLDLFLEREDAVLGGPDELVDAVDLVQDRAVLAARLDAAQLPLVLLLLLLEVGELAFGAPALELRFLETLAKSRDRVDPLAVLPVDVGELLGNRVALSLSVLDEPKPVLQPVQLVEDPAQARSLRNHPEKKKGGPLRGRPFSPFELSFLVGLFRLKLSVPLFRGPHPGGSTRIRTEV